MVNARCFLENCYNHRPSGLKLSHHLREFRNEQVLKLSLTFPECKNASVTLCFSVQFEVLKTFADGYWKGKKKRGVELYLKEKYCIFNEVLKL